MGIDIGGTKTLIALLDDDGVIKDQAKLPTNEVYGQFLKDLKKIFQNFGPQHNLIATGVAVPAVSLDRVKGRAINFGNLPWKNVNIKEDIETICDSTVVVENDAKLAALSESMLLKEYGRVLYVTISTGIGYALVVDGQIDTNIGDGGGRTILLEHNNSMMPWEDFASGRAIVERYGKRAEDITESNIWQAICSDLAEGLIYLIGMTEPEIIVIGGSVGLYFDRYGELLGEEIKKYRIPLVKMPKLSEAKRPELAVVYGCYDLAKQVYPHHAISNR